MRYRYIIATAILLVLPMYVEERIRQAVIRIIRLVVITAIRQRRLYLIE